MDPMNNDLNSEIPTPVNPVIQPSGNAAPEMPGATDAANSASASTLPEMPNLDELVLPEPPVPPVDNTTFTPPTMNPAVINPATMMTPDLTATDPITMPEPVKEPDPVELELNAPMKAAEPVPGSIGSAISVPTEEQQPQVVNNPMEQTQNVLEKPKKKMSKSTVTLLFVLAGMTIIALAAVLIYELTQ